MSGTALPSYEQVGELPPLLEGEVVADFIDVNGHMNIRHYLDAGAQGADQVCRRIGIDDDYRATRRLGVFTAEHHIRYFSEMHLGEKFSVHTVVVDRSGRAGHLLSFILDRASERLACTVEIILVGVDMDTRRPAEFPADVAAGLDEWVAAARALPWPLPLSGAMGIRR
ncbi:thioesterase family protein [Nocardioides nitrophenolicus]|uniref:thioesterase family protein n=1 Tax=Nocardioides nitrophenolicus TaxID=60489 RepID=UPI00195BAD1C|nr:thioesterase family protein [Nocardioides nitrophenolicus]MBM7517975.1 acyl-CoA thioester hydrolase [Nocardioides nitrophenolicus]